MLNEEIRNYSATKLLESQKIEQYTLKEKHLALRILQ
jgi:hypothetical protein